MSTSRTVAVSLWSIVLSTSLAAESASQQGPDSDSCGRVLSLTCASPTSSARLLFKAGDRDSYREVVILADQRPDVMARLGDAPSGRLVCVASDVGRSVVTTTVLSRSQQLTIRDDLQASGRLASVFSTCDPSVQAPVPLREVRPSYTVDDLRARTDGTVLLHGVVDEQGQVIDVRIVRSLSVGLDNESTRAFVQWRFKPALRLGKPVAVAITGEFQFHSGLEGQRPGR